MSRLPALVAAFCLLGASAAFSQGAAPDVGRDRQTQLIRMVRQDCGSCHGIQLTGGLGPALTRDRMADFPLDSLVAVVYHGRPGTPMPGWKSMISEADAHWIAQQLQLGFPLEAGKVQP